MIDATTARELQAMRNYIRQREMEDFVAPQVSWQVTVYEENYTSVYAEYNGRHALIRLPVLLSNGALEELKHMFVAAIAKALIRDEEKA